LRIRSLVPVRSALSRAQRIVAYLTPQEISLLAEADRKPKSPPAPLRPRISPYGNEIPFYLNPRRFTKDPAAGRVWGNIIK